MGQILFDTWNMGESPQLGSSVTKYDSGEIFLVTQIKLMGWLKLEGGEGASRVEGDGVKQL